MYRNVLHKIQTSGKLYLRQDEIHRQEPGMDHEIKNTTEQKVGFISSLLLTLLTITGFGFALIAVPPAGPYCPENCMEYPYPDILKYFPNDYYWMYIISFQLIVYLIFIIANHFNAPVHKKIYSFIAVSLAIITTTVLLADYFIQFSVVPISMVKGHTEGIPLLTQYNGNGIFIALEELGFIVMSLSFLFLSPIFTGNHPLEKSMRWIFALPSVGVLISFIYYSVEFGLDRDYRFEVAVITIDWLATIIIGVLSSIYFLKKMRTYESQP